MLRTKPFVSVVRSVTNTAHVVLFEARIPLHLGHYYHKETNFASDYESTVSQGIKKTYYNFLYIVIVAYRGFSFPAHFLISIAEKTRGIPLLPYH